MSKKEVDISIEKNKKRFHRSGYLVVVGLLIELEIAFLYPEYEYLVVNIGAILASLFVGAGVFAELKFGDRLSDDQEYARKLQKQESDEKIAEANARAEEAKLELGMLMEKLQPRSLNQSQHDFIKSLNGKISSVNIAFDTDAETRYFASQIKDAFMFSGIEVFLYPRAADVHGVGTLIYDPHAFANPNGLKTNGEPFVSIFRGEEEILGSVALITSLPTDIDAPSDMPMLIIGGRFAVTPPWWIPNKSAPKADLGNKT